ncbi:ABC transporter permease [Heliophilum fasciatum]|uniref:Putative ABC transport system permease protein n=1 Tax=Heliophilum fasciatum TaxID=35700 RepID=A0A4R2RMR7_9FIRM|nr:ABC transporter permease [Heliophilum fasciatum]MCW2278220.1 putative ABC transport system permease protein [Heliophilum fasciatum]TCP63959.1 putative ABC transport system permease protein [Heliophilum fasciatum]
MIFLESCKMALASLLSNKLRSLLTMLGIIIGVSSVVTMISVGQGAQKSVTSQIGSLGSNVLYVNSGRVAAMPGASQGARGATQLLTMAEYELIRQAKGDLIQDVVPEAGTQSTVQFGKTTTTTTVTGTTADYARVRNFKATSGRFLKEQEVTNRENVAVLGSTVADDLFAGANPLGQKIRVGREAFTVIGVMEAKKSGPQDLGDQIFIPLTTAQKRLTGSNGIKQIIVTAVSAEKMDSAQGQIEKILTRKLGSAEKFTIRNQQDIIETVQSTTETLTLLLAGITGISLLVGGIGIMNIMLVSVTERTREIGIRKALGAKQKHILFQFLVESTTLSSLGGLIGVLVGIGASSLIASLGQWTTSISPASVLISFGFSSLVGVFFGIYPAKRAASLHPIDALRYE